MKFGGGVVVLNLGFVVDTFEIPSDGFVFAELSAVALSKFTTKTVKISFNFIAAFHASFCNGIFSPFLFPSLARKILRFYLIHNNNAFVALKYRAPDAENFY